jgi:hypothetical protein
MTVKKPAKKTTTKKRKTNELEEKKSEIEKPAVKKPYRVQCKAGLVTYNNPNVGVMDYKEFLQRVKVELQTKRPDFELSLCLEKESRLHMHIFYETTESCDFDLQYLATALSGEVGDIQRNNGKNLGQGHYYCQCVYKTSHVECIFDVKKNPCGDWLMNLWKRDKIEDIERALAAEKLSHPRYQMQISAVNNQREKEKVEKMIEERAARMKAKLKRFAVIPEVQQWLELFESEDFRYPFLVLCGPSKLRKTEFAKSLFKNPFPHKDKVDWDGYAWDKNDAIIFDDVSKPDHIWQYVKKNKVLFQSSGIVSVNNSSTNCYKRDICVCQIPIVICTNENVKEPCVSAEDIAWIGANSVWITVSSPIPFFDEKPVAIEDAPAPLELKRF